LSNQQDLSYGDTVKIKGSILEGRITGFCEHGVIVVEIYLPESNVEKIEDKKALNDD